MSRFTVTRSSMGAQEVLVLRDSQAQREIHIARRGATLLSINLPVAGGSRNIADAFLNEQELVPHKGSRFAVMTPFANRINDARYTFEGKSYDLQPGAIGADRAIRHGFVRGVMFDVADEANDDDRAVVTFKTQAIRPDAFPGYPFALDFSITFSLDAKGLSIETHTRNVGDHAAPVFFGWHPYFRLSENAIDTWELQVPANTVIATDSGFIPLPGREAWKSIDDVDASLDFRQPRSIGATELNTTYTDLQVDEDGKARTYLRDPKTGTKIAVWQERGVMLAFTSDTNERDPRKSVALEPMECMADAFNREDCASLLRLAPGEERRFICGVEFGS
ncbi:MAG: aldose epimerase [Luteibacter sp.]